MKYARFAALFVASGLLGLSLGPRFGQTAPSSSSVLQATADGLKPSAASSSPPPAPTNPSIPADLDTVRALRRAGLTEAAMSELHRWIQQNPKTAIPTDIKELLANLDDNALDVARAYRDAGLLEMARTSLQQSLQQHPKSPLPKDLAGLLPGPVDNSLQLARAYKETRSLDAAATELQRWIQRHPESPVPADLKDLLPGRSDALLWRFRHAVAFWIVPILEALGVLGLLVLIVLRMAGVGRPYLVIGDFDSSGTDAALGKRLAALVRQRLAEPLSASSTLTIATGPVEPAQIPADITSGLSSMSSVAQTVLAVFRWASPRRVVTITGLLHPQGLRGVGATLTIGEDQNASNSVTIWQEVFEPDFVPVSTGSDAALAAQPYDSLIAPSVTWLQFHMYREYGSDKKSPFQTRDWRSQAAFEAGLRLSNFGRSEAARTMYLKALGHDPSNLGARLNLALLLSWSDIREQIKQLEYVATKSKGETGDSTYYSAAFSLAMALVDNGQISTAGAMADELVGLINRDLNLAASRKWYQLRKAKPSPALEQYLRLVKPSAQVVAATLKLEPLPTDLDTLWPSTEFQYNLACYYSMRGGDDLTRSLGCLEFAALLNPSKVARQAAKEANTLLKNVSTSPQTTKRFAAIVAEPAPPVAAPTTPSVLASLVVIGPERAAVLLSQDVATPADLIVRCTTFTAASTLADSVGVSLPTLLRLARVAELMRLPHIQPAHVNALTLAGFDSLDALRGVAPATLAAALRDWCKDTPLPPANTIDAWALEIINLPSFVLQDIR